MVPDVHPFVNIQVHSSLLKHHAEEYAEEYAEEGRCQDTTLLHAVGDRKGFAKVTIESDLAALVLMQLDNHLQKFERTAKTFENKPQTRPTHTVKGFCKVNKSDIESFVLFTALFLELAEDKHYVCRASIGSEATLALGDIFFGDGWYEPVKQDPGKYFASDGEQCDASVIGALRLYTLVLVQGYDRSITKILWQLALLPATDEENVKFVKERRTPILPDFWWNVINSCCFATLELIYDYTQFMEGGLFIELLFE